LFIFTLPLVPTDAPASIEDYTGFFSIASQNAKIFRIFLGFIIRFYAQGNLKGRFNPQKREILVIYRI
jgi:hypothetical protein